MADPVLLSNGELTTDSGVPVPVTALPGNIVTGNDGIAALVALDDAAYQALDPVVATTLYIVTDTGAIMLGETEIVAGA